MSMRHHFETLGIPPTKNIAVIKKAYRKKALQYHPDKNPSASAKDKFIAITEAYEQILWFVERKNHPQNTDYSNYNKKQATPQKTASEIREEKIRKAKQRYEQMKRKEEEENERYFQSITSGKTWKRFKLIMYMCTFTSLFIFLDFAVFPTQTQVSSIVSKNTQIQHSGSSHHLTSPVKFENGQKAWIAIPFIQMEQNNYLYLERTFLFKDIKYVKIWKENEWLKYVPDYSLTSTFPLIPFVLLFPLITFYIKARTIMFSFCFYISMRLIPLVFLIFLYSNDRWMHLISLLM